MASYQGVATSIPKLHTYMINTDEGDYSSIIIMQDDGIHAKLRYTQQAYVATASDENNTCYFCAISS